MTAKGACPLLSALFLPIFSSFLFQISYIYFYFSELNIFCSSDLVSQDFVLENLKAVKRNRHVVKLEIELDLSSFNDYSKKRTRPLDVSGSPPACRGSTGLLQQFTALDSERFSLTNKIVSLLSFHDKKSILVFIFVDTFPAAPFATFPREPPCLLPFLPNSE